MMINDKDYWSHHDPDHNHDDNDDGRQYGAGTEVPIKSLLGHRSQAPPEVDLHHDLDLHHEAFVMKIKIRIIKMISESERL